MPSIAKGHSGPLYLQAFWDDTDDWSLFDTTGNTEVVRTHVPSPASPYRGGLGRMESNFVGSSTDFDSQLIEMRDQEAAASGTREDQDAEALAGN